MKCFVIKKQQIVSIMKITVIVAIAINLSCAAVFVHRSVEPITSVITEAKKVALTVEPNSCEEADRILSLAKAEGVKLTFFLSNEFFGSFPDKAREIKANGHCIGILLTDMKDCSRKYINDWIAEDIETLAAATEVNARFVRFQNNEFDTQASAQVYALGLTPVQWASDESAEEFGNGDIILIADSNDLAHTMQRLKTNGFGFFTLNDIK